MSHLFSSGAYVKEKADTRRIARMGTDGNSSHALSNMPADGGIVYPFGLILVQDHIRQ